MPLPFNFPCALDRRAEAPEATRRFRPADEPAPQQLSIELGVSESLTSEACSPKPSLRSIAGRVHRGPFQPAGSAGYANWPSSFTRNWIQRYAALGGWP